MRYKKPEIIYEDSSVLVCRKEAGLAVQTAKTGQTDLVSLLKNERAAKGEPPYIGLIHRLDQPVEGVMVFAKTKAAAASLSEQVRNRDVEKRYLAVTCGIPKQARGTLCDTLLRDGRTNTSRVVAKGTQGAKEASLDYEVLQTDPEQDLALLEIRLHTGRHHQIRVQFSHAGYPLYADRKYGKPLPASVYCPVALCSMKVGFIHPDTGKEMEFEIQPSGKGFASFFC